MTLKDVVVLVLSLSFVWSLVLSVPYFRYCAASKSVICVAASAPILCTVLVLNTKLTINLNRIQRAEHQRTVQPHGA